MNNITVCVFSEIENEYIIQAIRDTKITYYIILHTKEELLCMENIDILIVGKNKINDIDEIFDDFKKHNPKAKTLCLIDINNKLSNIQLITTLCDAVIDCNKAENRKQILEYTRNKINTLSEIITLSNNIIMNTFTDRRKCNVLCRESTIVKRRKEDYIREHFIPIKALYDD